MSSHCGKDDENSSLRGTWEGGRKQSRGVNIREEVNSITVLLDALLPVLHEVTQGEQDIIAHRDLVFRRPGFHSYQDDACVQLLLVDLLETTLRCRNNKFSINHSITDYWNSITHSIGHVHHWFGKVLRLCCGTTPLHKLERWGQNRQTAIDLHLFSALNYLLLSDISVPAHGHSQPSARCTWFRTGRYAGLAAPGKGNRNPCIRVWCPHHLHPGQTDKVIQCNHESHLAQTHR